MPKRNRKKRQKDVTLPYGDIGPNTAAQMAGAMVIIDEEKNGAKIQRKRRMHVLEHMKARRQISDLQCAAGLELHKRFCKTELSGESAFSRVFVDSSPRPGEVSLRQAERVTHLAALSKHIPSAMRPVVDQVVIRGDKISGPNADSDKALLREALDLLANKLTKKLRLRGLTLPR